MIQVSGLSKAYGKQTLYQDISFSINRGERIGLVARNGHGKSTLFRILLGEEDIDDGKIIVPDDYRIGHLSQHLKFAAPTVLEEACEILNEQQEFEQTYQAEAVLQGLGFTTEDFSKDPHQLSGGFQVRLNLAKQLLGRPNLLLLDEPTNYLDIVSMRWLQRFLQSWKDELILITHDREFMDSVSTHTIALHRAKLRKVSGSTAKLSAQLEQEEEIHEQTRINQLKKRKETEDFVRRFRAKASKAKAVQSKVKELERNVVADKLEDIDTLSFKFTAAPFPGKWLSKIEHLSFSYPDGPQLIKDLSISVAKNDRIAVVGKNGRGKTTFLNLLASELSYSSGKIENSNNLKLAYFGQTNVERLCLTNTIEEEIMHAHPDNSRGVARSISGAMMFEGDLALKKISVLSGGEKSRVLLGKLLLKPANLLLLDEPSNHLDMYSTEALVEAVEQFTGAVVFVTHSEMIIRKLATRLIVFDGGETFLFEGTYDDFLQRHGWSDESETKKPKKKVQESYNKKELRKLRADVVSRRSKALNPLKKQISDNEQSIEQLEASIEEKNTLLVELSKDGFGEDAAKLSRELSREKQEVEVLFEELDRLSKLYDSENLKFDEELAKLK